jgi:alkylhydroperoxidase family enzyme
VLLGRAAGIDDERLAHLGDDALPQGLFDDESTAIIEYSQASTRMIPISDEIYGALGVHFDQTQIVELCFVVGFSNMVNRFHATFLTTVDEATSEALTDACPLPLPPADAPGRR